MLRSVFIGSNNEFNQALIDWLRRECDLRGVVWVSAWAWRRSWRGRLGFLRRRLRRVGPVRTADEALFWAWYNAFDLAADQETLRRRVLEPYWAEHGRPEWRGDQITADRVNSEATRHFVSERRPDVVFAMCINHYFGRRLRQIPRHGVLLWHEGITPEYRGLYSPFWAIHNLEFDKLGCTLLRMNDEYDAGEILVQRRVADVDPIAHRQGFIGHKAIWDSRPAVARLLHRLENEDAVPLSRAEAEDGYYSYPGLTDLIRQRRRLRRLDAGHGS